MAEGRTEIGKITHFYSRINVAVIELTASLSVGDKIVVRGETTNVEQIVDSMQIEHVNIQKAEEGQSVGLKVRDKVRSGDKVYK